MICPDCSTARAARALVLDHDFAANAWRAALPFVLIAIVIAVILRRVRHHDG